MRRDPQWQDIQQTHAALEVLTSPRLQRADQSADQKFNNALRNAAALNDVSALKRALGNSAQIDSVDAQGRTAAHFSATNGNPACLKALLLEGIDINRYGIDLVKIVVQKQQALAKDNVKFKDYAECLQSLIDCGAATDGEVLKFTQQIKEAQRAEKRKLEAFALAKIAVGNSNADDLQNALESGADVNTLEEGETLADLAIKEASAECLQIILQNNFDINTHGKRLLELAGIQLIEHENNPDIATELDACVQILTDFGAEQLQEEEEQQQQETHHDKIELDPTTQNSDPDSSEFEHTEYLKEDLDALMAEDELKDGRMRRPPPPAHPPQGLIVENEQVRQEFEKSRSFPGQVMATHLICSIGSERFVTAGGFTKPIIPNFEVRDSVIRVWSNTGTCIEDFNASMTMDIKGAKYQPRSLCMINPRFLAVGYDTAIVHIYDTTTQILEKRLDLQDAPPTSPRLVSRASFRKKTIIDNSAVAIPLSRNSSSGKFTLGRNSRSTTITEPQSSTPEKTRSRTSSTSEISPRGQKVTPVEVDMCQWPVGGLNRLATSYQSTVKIWDIEKGTNLTQLTDGRAKNIIKIRPVAQQGLFGLDNQGNGFLWDHRENTAKKSSVGFFRVASKRINPCVATFNQQNLVAISYQAPDKEKGSLIKLWDIRKYKAPCLTANQKIPRCAFGSVFCAMNDNELAFTTSSTFSRDFPIDGNSNMVNGQYIGLYHIGKHTVRFVDFISQDPNDPSKQLPKVIAMEKIAEHTLALGIFSDKGKNTLKISHTNQRVYTDSGSVFPGI